MSAKPFAAAAEVAGCKGPTAVWYGYGRPSTYPEENRGVCECGMFQACRHCGRHHVEILMCGLCGRANPGEKAAAALAARTTHPRLQCVRLTVVSFGPFAGQWHCGLPGGHAGKHAVDTENGVYTWT